MKYKNYMMIQIYIYIYMEHLGKWCPVPTEIETAEDLVCKQPDGRTGAEIVAPASRRSRSVWRVVAVADWTKHRSIESSWVFPRKMVIWWIFT